MAHDMTVCPGIIRLLPVGVIAVDARRSPLIDWRCLGRGAHACACPRTYRARSQASQVETGTFDAASDPRKTMVPICRKALRHTVSLYREITRLHTADTVIKGIHLEVTAA